MIKMDGEYNRFMEDKERVKKSAAYRKYQKCVLKSRRFGSDYGRAEIEEKNGKPLIKEGVS